MLGFSVRLKNFTFSTKWVFRLCWTLSFGDFVKFLALTYRLNFGCYRKLLGQNLETCSIQELHEIDIQLEKSLKIIRARKVLYIKKSSLIYISFQLQLQLQIFLFLFFFLSRKIYEWLLPIYLYWKESFKGDMTTNFD